MKKTLDFTIFNIWYKFSNFNYSELLYCHMKVENSARLPYEITKGDRKTKYNNIIAANERLFDAIISNPENKKIEKLEELMADEFILTGKNEKKLATKPKINIDTIKKSFLTNKYEIIGCESEIKENDAITGLKIKTKGENNQIADDYIGQFMHEATHAFHHLFDPKILARSANLGISEEQLEKIEKFYLNELYNEESFEFYNTIIGKIKLHKALSGLTIKQKINVLQHLRQSLVMEDFAYWQQEKFSGKAEFNGLRQVECADVTNYMFEDKIEFLDSEIYKLINKQRKLNKKNANQARIDNII